MRSLCLKGVEGENTDDDKAKNDDGESSGNNNKQRGKTVAVTGDRLCLAGTPFSTQYTEPLFSLLTSLSAFGNIVLSFVILIFSPFVVFVFGEWVFVA